jgi:hypothetical protein
MSGGRYIGEGFRRVNDGPGDARGWRSLDFKGTGGDFKGAGGH